MGIIGGVIVAVVIVVAILVGILKMVKKRNETRCPQCKTKYDYDSGEVGWRLRGTTIRGDKKRYDVEIHCKCNKCGLEQLFWHTFRTSDMEMFGSTHIEPLDEIVRGYFL